MIEAITFSVSGLPQSQGSKRAFVNPVTGKAIITEAGGARHKSWREAVRAEAQKASGELEHWQLLDGPLSCTLSFYLPRPKSAPKRVWAPVSKPDIDKMTRSVLDAMTGVVFIDDARIVLLVASKHYATDHPPGCVVTVRRMGATEEEHGQGGG